MAYIQHLLRLMELGRPFYYAAAVFFLFRYLDKKASWKANKAASQWIRSNDYTAADAKGVLVELFDRLYTSPLWSFRAIARSITLSAIFTILTVNLLYPHTFYFALWCACGMTLQFAMQVVTNAVVDYLSLHAIRRWLQIGVAPIVAMFIGPLMGLIAILALYTIVDVARFSIETRSFHLRYFYEGLMWWIHLIANYGITSKKSILVGAMVIHLWLPLLAIGVIGVRALNFLRTWSAAIQWFLKAGNQHPLQAIGYVAAFSTFCVTAVFAWLPY